MKEHAVIYMKGQDSPDDPIEERVRVEAFGDDGFILIDCSPGEARKLLDQLGQLLEVKPAL